MYQNRIMKKGISVLLCVFLVAGLFTTPVFGLRLDASQEKFDINTQIYEIKFTMEYTQYINIAVYTSLEKMEANEPIGYIAKNYLANGKNDYIPHPYRTCPAGGPDHTGAATDMPYRLYTGPMPIDFVQPFSLSLLEMPTDPSEEESRDAIDDGKKATKGEEGYKEEDSQVERDPGQNQEEEELSKTEAEISETKKSLADQTQTLHGTLDATERNLAEKEEEEAAEQNLAEKEEKDAAERNTKKEAGEIATEDQEETSSEVKKAIQNQEETSSEVKAGAVQRRQKSSVNYAPIPDEPMIQNIETKVITLEEYEEKQKQKTRSGVMLFAFPQATTPTAIEDDTETEGGNVIYWNGRYNASVGTNAPAKYYPIPPENEDEDFSIPYIRIEPVGYPWKNVAPSCTSSVGPAPDYEVTYTHDPGENWEWSSHPSFYAEIAMVPIDYHAGIYFMLPQGELKTCLDDYLSQYQNGDLSWEDLVYNLEVGEPINGVTGGYHFNYKDLEVHGDWPLTWMRMYNSLDQTECGLGKGFSHLYDFTLEDNMGILYIEGPYGETVQFLREETSSGDVYRPMQHSPFTLKSTNGVDYYLTYQDGSVYTFYEEKLMKIETAKGETIAALSYDGEQLKTVSNRAGSFTLSWSGDHITKVEDHTGRFIAYGYEDENLTSYTNADGDSLSYTYEEIGLIHTVSDFNGDVYLENTYDDERRVTYQEFHTAGGTTTMEVSYDDTNYVNTVKTFEGAILQYHYDHEGLLLQIEEEDQKSFFNKWTEDYQTEKRSSKGEEGIQYEFDGNKNVTKVTYQDGNIVKTNYDSQNRVIERIFGESGERGAEEFTYDGGNLASFKDREGGWTYFSYQGGLLTESKDPEGNITKFEYNGKGQKTKVIDAEGNATGYEYDALGRLTKVTEPNGATSIYTYSSGGKLLSVTDSYGNTVEYGYDKNGSVIESSDFLGNFSFLEYGVFNLETKVTDREGNTTEYGYDKNGRLISETDFDGNTTQYGYDQKGNLVSESDAERNETTYEYDHLNRLSTVTDPKGYTESYTYDSMGRLASITDKNGTVTEYEYDLDGNVIKEVKDGGADGTAEISYTYDNLGRIRSMTDAEQNTTTYTYDKNGRLLKETDAAGRSIAYAYDKLGRVKTTTDGEGNTVKYEYDQIGNVIEEIDPRGNATLMEYDLLGRMTKQNTPKGNSTSYTYDANGNLITVTDPENGISHYTYDKLDRMIAEKDPLGNVATYDYYGTYGVEIITYPDGLTQQYQYNCLGLVENITDRAGNTSSSYYDERQQLERSVDRGGYETTYTYIPSGAAHTITRDGIRIQECVYDGFGNLSSVMDPKGITSYGYDLNGRTTERRDKNGNQTLYRYDGSGLLMEEEDALGNITRYTYDMAGREIQQTDKVGLITKTEYDGNGTIIQVIKDDQGRETKTQYTYDQDNHLVLETDPNGNMVSYAYDKKGLLVKEETLGVPAPQVVKYEYGYDAAGNRTSRKDPKELTISYTYDWAGNLLSEKNQLGHIESYTYDANHNQISVKDRLGNESKYTYDGLNRLVQEEDPEGGKMRYAYDAFDNLISTEQLLGDNTWNKTEFRADPLGNPVKEITALGFEKTWETDGEGNITRITDMDGNVIQLTYDVLNHMKTAKYGQEPVITYTYDALGNILKVEEEMGTTTLSYDGHSRRKEVTDHNGNTITYTYDHNGNKTAIAYPDQKVASYTYDHRNRLTGLTWEGETKTYQYDPKSQVLEEVYPSGEKTTYSYDEAGYLKEGKEMDTNGRTIRQTSYSYRDNGLLWNETRTGIGVEKREEILLYSYDKADRLIKTSKTTDTEIETTTYAYDVAGNLVKETDGKDTITYSYNKQNQLTAKRGKEEADYQYDKRGNLIKEKTKEGNKEYVYDATGKLVSGTNETGEESVYVYNGLNARVLHEEIRSNSNTGHQNSSFFPGSWKESLVLEHILKEERDDWQRIWETSVGTVRQNDRETVTKHYLPDYTSYALRDILVTEDGSFTQSYVYADGALTPTLLNLEYLASTERTGGNSGENPGSDIAKNVTSQVWYHGSHLLGSNLYAVSTDGDVRFHMSYDAWGNPKMETKLDMNFHGLDNINNYTGYTYDEVLGIYYAQARFYDPEVKRFIQEDPIKDEMNWYSYCGNNPVTNMDPSGWLRAAGVYEIRGIRKYYEDPDAAEFGVNSVIYKALLELSDSYKVVTDNRYRERIAALAEEVRKIGRETRGGTLAEMTVPKDYHVPESFIRQLKLNPTEHVLMRGYNLYYKWMLYTAYTASQMTTDVYGEAWQNGSVADTYRHGVWSMLLEYHTSSKFASFWLDAHEFGYQQNLSAGTIVLENGLEVSHYTLTEMDLYNNNEGRYQGVLLKKESKWLSLKKVQEEAHKRIVWLIENGTLKMVY